MEADSKELVDAIVDNGCPDTEIEKPDELAKVRVSVIIPHYNRPEMLVEAVRSIYEQTWKPDEIIVVDNASDHEILAAVLPHLEEMGAQIVYRDAVATTPATLYNDGIEASTGDVLMFLDDDNAMHPARIAGCMQAMLESKSECVYTAMEAVYDQDGSGRIDVDENKPTLIPKLPDFRSVVTKPKEQPIPIDVIHANDICITRRALDFVGWFDEMLASSIGMELVIRMNRAGFKCVYLPIPLVYYRIWKEQRGMHQQYPDIDRSKSRPYIIAKEGIMRKQIKVWVFGHTGSDPFQTFAIGSIPWVTFHRFDIPMMSLARRIDKDKPNFLVHPNLAGATASERAFLRRCGVVTIGCADAIGSAIEPADLAAGFPEADWYVTNDQDESLPKRRTRAIQTEPPTDDPAGWWAEVLNRIRCNRS